MESGPPGEAVDALGAPATEPSLDVLDERAQVAARALQRDLTRRALDRDGVALGVGHLGARAPAGIGALLEGGGGDAHVEDVSDPSAREALGGLPLLVGPDRGRGRFVDRFVAAGQRCRHAADRDRAVLEADRDEPAEDVGQEVRRLDVHAEAVRPDHVRVGHDELQDARLEVPARRVEPGRVGAKRVQHLLHLIDGRQRLDERDAADHGAAQVIERRLALGEEVAPERGLGGRLHLGQVEVDALPSLGLGAARVEQRERRPQDRRRDGLLADRHLGLVEVQAALAVHEEG